MPMKTSIIDELKDILTQSKDWVRLEVEYLKLTASEKLTILLSTAILCTISIFVAVIIIALITMALVNLFQLILSPPLACVCVAGILLLLLGVCFLLRKQLIINPVARFITRIFFENSNTDSPE